MHRVLRDIYEPVHLGRNNFVLAFNSHKFYAMRRASPCQRGCARLPRTQRLNVDHRPNENVCVTKSPSRYGYAESRSPASLCRREWNARRKIKREKELTISGIPKRPATPVARFAFDTSFSPVKRASWNDRRGARANFVISRARWRDGETIKPTATKGEKTKFFFSIPFRIVSFSRA